MTTLTGRWSLKSRKIEGTEKGCDFHLFPCPLKQLVETSLSFKPSMSGLLIEDARRSEQLQSLEDFKKRV